MKRRPEKTTKQNTQVKRRTDKTRKEKISHDNKTQDASEDNTLKE